MKLTHTDQINQTLLDVKVLQMELKRELLKRDTTPDVATVTGSLLS